MTENYINASRLVSGFTHRSGETRAACGRPGEVSWVRGTGDQTELKSPRLPSPIYKPQLESWCRAPGHAPGWEPPQRECPLQTVGKKPVTKINAALPKPEESPAVQFKNNLKNNSGEMITASAQRGWFSTLLPPLRSNQYK